MTVPSDYNPNRINPYTGQPFGPPPPGVIVRPNKGYYENAAPLDSFAPRFGFAWQPGTKQSRMAVRGGYGWFYQFSNPGTNFGTANFGVITRTSVAPRLIQFGLKYVF